MISEIERVLAQWHYPEDVIRANHSLQDILIEEREKLSTSDDKMTARALAKKVVQHRFGLPRKTKIEVISIYPLKYGFCSCNDPFLYRRKKRMGLHDFLLIWKNLEAITTEVEFTGGEPLLNPDVFDMITESNKTGIYSTLTTNAFLLNRECADKVLKVQPNKILIAYDSVSLKHNEKTRIGGEFKLLRDNVTYLVRQKRKLGQERPEINIQIVLNTKNKKGIDLFWHEAKMLGVDSASIKPVLVWSGLGAAFEKKMIDESLIPDHPIGYPNLDKCGNLIKDRQPGFCSNIEYVHIGSGSEVIPCWYFLKDSYKAGYAADEPFLDIWFSNEYRDYRQRMKDETVHEDCHGCIRRYDHKLFITREFNKKTFDQSESPSIITEQDSHFSDISGSSTPSVLPGDINIACKPVHELHTCLNLHTRISYPSKSLNKSLDQWKMEVDDAPIFRYIYRHFRPRRHLEFGTWQGSGTVYCLEECDATVWTVNLFDGENKSGGGHAYSNHTDELPELQTWAQKIGMSVRNSYRTDTLGFIGRNYLKRNLGNRVCQIYCDSKLWDTSNFPTSFFDTVLIDGGHQCESVISDTQKALPLLRSHGIMMWHDFCPPVFQKFQSTRGVMQAIYLMWEVLSQEMDQLFWIKPSWILLGVKK